MAGIIKTDKRQGNIIGVANCASFGKDKTTAYTATNTSAPLGSGTRLMDYLVVAGGGAGGLSGGAGGGGSGGYLNSVAGENSGGGATTTLKSVSTKENTTLNVQVGGGAPAQT